jgi:hypothetical protein
MGVFASNLLPAGFSWRVNSVGRIANRPLLAARTFGTVGLLTLGVTGIIAPHKALEHKSDIDSSRRRSILVSWNANTTA